MVTPQAEQARGRPSAAPRSSLVPVPGQGNLGRPDSVLDTSVPVSGQAAELAKHQLDQISVQSLDIGSEAHLACTTLAEGRK